MWRCETKPYLIMIHIKMLLSLIFYETSKKTMSSHLMAQITAPTSNHHIDKEIIGPPNHNSLWHLWMKLIWYVASFVKCTCRVSLISFMLKLRAYFKVCVCKNVYKGGEDKIHNLLRGGKNKKILMWLYLVMQVLA